jgi:hypothetical protein
MNLFVILLLLVVSGDLAAQSGPVKATFGYSREIISGIPSSPGREQPKQLPNSYFIYVVVKRGLIISDATVYLRGDKYKATLKKVDTPLLIDHDPSVPTGRKDTLVPKTSDDVYEVEPEEHEESKDPTGEQLARRNQAVVVLRSGQDKLYGVVRELTRLRPAAAM